MRWSPEKSGLDVLCFDLSQKRKVPGGERGSRGGHPLLEALRRPRRLRLSIGLGVERQPGRVYEQKPDLGVICVRAKGPAQATKVRNRREKDCRSRSQKETPRAEDAALRCQADD